MITGPRIYHHFYHGIERPSMVAGITFLIGGFVALSAVVNTVVAVRTAVDPGYPERVEQIKIETEARQDRAIADWLVWDYQNGPMDNPHRFDLGPNDQLAAKQKAIACAEGTGFAAADRDQLAVNPVFMNCIAS